MPLIKRWSQKKPPGKWMKNLRCIASCENVFCHSLVLLSILHDSILSHLIDLEAPSIIYLLIVWSSTSSGCSRIQRFTLYVRRLQQYMSLSPFPAFVPLFPYILLLHVINPKIYCYFSLLFSIHFWSVSK